MYHSQCEVFIYNVANCQLLFYFHSIEDVRSCQEEELYQGTGHGKAMGWVDAAVNNAVLAIGELLWGSHEVVGHHSPQGVSEQKAKPPPLRVHWGLLR